MKKLFMVYALCPLAQLLSLSVSLGDAHAIAQKIWQNECGGKLENLTHWNQGENFPSLGIGHFIWYPAGKKERFEETFPELLKFLQQQPGVVCPEWLKKDSGAPWSSKEEFDQAKGSVQMLSLRQFLWDTRDLQAIFIVNRACVLKHSKLTHLAATADGLYALVDYLNFKGEGTNLAERYKGEGWGLLQVLEQMPEASDKPLVDFVQAAKAVLERRVRNSPEERHEERWLKGWFNRLDTYVR